MNRVGLVLGAVISFAAVDAVYALLLSASSPRGADEDPMAYAITSAVLASPAGVAAVLLWGSWWLGTGERLIAMDAPARLLAAAVATLPPDRREWASAMTAELAQVPDRRERWRFAIGCARTAVFLPRGRWAPVLGAAALVTATAAVTAVAVDRMLPQMRVFAVTFVALIGVLATIAMSRVRRLHRPRAGLAATSIGLVGVAAGIAVTAYYLRTDAAIALDQSAAITLGVLMAVGLWLSLVPPPALTSSRRARRVGLVVGLVFAAGMLASSRITDGGVGLYVLGGPVVALFLAGFFVALRDRSFGAGLQAGVWTVLTTCLLSFAVYVIEAARYQRIGVHPIDADPLTGSGAGMQLLGAIGWVLLFIPAAGLPFAVFGAAIGAVGSGATVRPRATTPSAP